MTTTAKLFMSGRSQAIRLPAKLRLQAQEVRIEQIGDAPDDGAFLPPCRRLIANPALQGRIDQRSQQAVSLLHILAGQFFAPLCIGFYYFFNHIQVSVIVAAR